MRITESSIYYDKDKNFVCALIKNSIPNDEIMKYIDMIPNKVKNKASNSRRSVPNGSQETKDLISKAKTSILGSFDRPRPRLTAFVKNHPEVWNKLQPLFLKVDRLYRNYLPDQYKEQTKLIKQVPSEYRIGKTVFTTITLNNNFQTPPHTDAGNIGYSVMIVAGHSYTGGDLVFPKHNLVVECMAGDMVIMSPSEEHCNTRIKLTSKDGRRFSVVLYIRTKLRLLK